MNSLLNTKFWQCVFTEPRFPNKWIASKQKKVWLYKRIWKKYKYPVALIFTFLSASLSLRVTNLQCTYIHTYFIGSSPRDFSESILHYKIILSAWLLPFLLFSSQKADKLDILRATFRKYHEQVCKMEKSKSPKLCHNKALWKLF